MTILEATRTIEEYRLKQIDKKALKYLDEWNDLLIDMNQFLLTEEEEIILHKELHVQFEIIERDKATSVILKRTLKRMLRFNRSYLRARYYNECTIAGIFLGLLLAFMMSIHILITVAAGWFLGRLLDHYLNMKGRFLNANPYETW